MYVQLKRTMVGICIGAMLMTAIPAGATPRVLSEGESLGTKLLQQASEGIIGIIVYLWEQGAKQPPPLPQPSIRTEDLRAQWLLELYRAYETCKKTKKKCGIKPNVTVINSVQNAGKALLKKHKSRCSDIAKTKVTIQNIAPFAYAIMHCQSTTSANLSEQGNAKPPLENKQKLTQRKNKEGQRGYVFKCTEAYGHNYHADNPQMMRSKVWMYEHFVRLNEAEKILKKQIAQITGTTKNDKTKKNALLDELKKINEEKQALRKHLMLLECDISFRGNGGGMPGGDPQADIIHTITDSQYKPEKPLDKTDIYPFRELYERYKLKDLDFNTF